MKMMTLFLLLTILTKASDTLYVYENIKQQGIKFSEITLAQSILETGMFKSNICKRNKNLFGMRKPFRRKTTAIGKRKGYAKYRSYEQSIKDFKLWQDSRKVKNMTKSKYLKMLRGYYVDKNYLKKLNKIVKNINKYKKVYIISH